MTNETATPEPTTRVSSLELFFDLVFVFAITQVTQVLGDGKVPENYARAVLILVVSWWMYGGYAWLTNNLKTTVTLFRFLILLAMTAFFVMALATPRAFTGDGVVFGVAYLLVNVIHAFLFTRSHNKNSARAIWRLAPLNIGQALLILAAGFTAGVWHWVLWGMTALSIVAMPLFRREEGFSLQASHFVERHGLVLLIVLGESVVSIGTGASNGPLTLPTVAAVALALALTAALWWSYFLHDEAPAEHALARAQGAFRSRLALYAFGYCQLVMIAGLVVMAAGVKLMLADPLGPAGVSAFLLAGGVAVFLGGEGVFRRVIRSRASRPLGAAMMAVATIPFGTLGSGVFELLVLVAVLVGRLVLDRVPKASPENHEGRT